jgi:hypothetical protein
VKSQNEAVPNGNEDRRRRNEWKAGSIGLPRASDLLDLLPDIWIGAVACYARFLSVLGGELEDEWFV